MRCYLVQHGEAKSEAEDPDRPLTDRGERQVRQVAAAAQAAGLVVTDRVVHSGKTRARQTAEIWGETLGVPVEVAEDGLGADDKPATWAERLGTDNVMLVGHLPHLGKLADLLIVNDPGRAVIIFRNGALVGLRQQDQRWSIEVVLPPGVDAP